MKIILSLLFLLMISMISCDRIAEQRKIEQYVSPYKGIYVGNYIGSDQGTLRLEISDKDFVTVNRTSNMYSFSEEFQGGMTGSAFNQVKSRTSNFAILGNIIRSAQNTYSGTWKIDEGTLGTWTLNKQ